MTSIALIGPGAIGGVVATWLAQDGANTLILCARTPFDGLEVETPDGTIAARPRLLTEPQDASPADWVLIATKAYDVASTAPWLTRLVGPASRLAVLQNGVEHIERFRQLAPVERIVPAVVDIPASRSAPGRMQQRAYGTIVVPEGPDGEAFIALFRGTRIAVATDPDFRSRAWQKLCLNAAGAVSALTLSATGPGWSPELEAIVRALAEECAAVGRAEGAQIPHAVIEAVVARARMAKPGARNSMEADRLADRPMEIEARNGVIVRLGLKHGIPTPINAMLVALLRAAEGSPGV